MKVLLAGAGGQLGQCLTEALKWRHEVVALSRDALDIVNLGKVRDAIGGNRPDVLINASAYNAVDAAESHPDEAYAVNALGPRNLAIASAARGIPVLHVSTDYVFDGSGQRPYHEFDRTNALSVYGASKLAGEDAVRSLSQRHYIVRTAWLFWERGKNFLLSMHGLAARPQLKVASDQFGSPTYVPHLAAAISELIETEAYGTYHLAGHGGASRWDLVSELFRRLGIDTPVLPVSHLEFPAPAPRPSYSVLASIQNPRIELPRWQEGVAEFARQLQLAESHRSAGAR
ncbi:MAG: dTDP-4-dehydrorhamnose reductase [Candidatus Binataceae bacterium]|jgi:dTDP-4-dehydrorhamnose reductase